MALIDALGPHAADVILMLGVLSFSLATAVVALLADY
jgi:hypothetical protein